MRTLITYTHACTSATSIVIYSSGGESFITFWDYSISHHDEAIFLNDEPVGEIQVAPPFVVLKMEREGKVVIADESDFRARALAAGIMLPPQPE